MTMIKASVPVFEYDLKEIEDDDGQKMEGLKKNWFKPVASSMAKLKQIETRVYSMRHTGASSLKPPHSAHKSAVHQQLTGWAQQHKNGIKSRNLSAQLVDKYMMNSSDHKAKSPKSASLFHTSTSELTARQKPEWRSHPSSAKIQNSPWFNSESRTRRLSATDSFCAEESDDDNSYTEPMAVRGKKKSVNAKLIYRCPLAKYQGHSANGDVEIFHHKQNTDAVIGHPTRCKFNGENIPSGHQYISQKMSGSSGSKGLTGLQELTDLKGPICRLVSDDKGKERDVTTKPQQQLCFFLPSAYYGSYEDGEDENDLPRFLQQYDESVHKKTDKDDCAVKTEIMARPPASDDTKICTNTNDIAFKSHIKNSSLKTTRSRVFDTIDKTIPNQSKGPLTNSEKNCDFFDRLDLVSNDHSALEEKSCDFYAAGDYMNSCQEKIVSNNIVMEQSVQNKGCERNGMTDNNANFIRSSHFLNNHAKLKLKSEILLRDNLKIREDNNLMLNNTQRNWRKIEVSKSPYSNHNKSADVLSERRNCFQHNDSICEPGLTGGISNKKSEKSGPTTWTSKKKCHNCDPLCNHANDNASNNEHDFRPITTVTVNYEDDEYIQELVSNHLKKVTRNELEVIASDLSQLDIGSHSSPTLGLPSRKRNFCERSTQAHFQPKSEWSTVKGNDIVPQDKSETQDTPALFKSTKPKTIGFSAQAPHGPTSKNVILSVNLRKKSKKHLQPKHCKSTAQSLQHGSLEKEQKTAKHRKKKQTQEETTDLKENEETVSRTNANIILTNSMSDLEVLEKMKAKAETRAFLDDTKELTPCDKTQETLKTTEKLFTPVQKPTKMINASSKSTKDIRVSKPSVKIKNLSAPKEKPQPFSYGMKTASLSDIFKSRPKVPKRQTKDSTTKIIRYSSAKAKPVQPKIAALRTVKSASAATRQQAKDLTTVEDETKASESEECPYMQTKMPTLGVDVGIRALERALYAPVKKMQYHHVAGYLPSDPSYGLLPHYKHWLPEEYQKLQMIKQKLADDDQLRYRQRFLNT